MDEELQREIEETRRELGDETLEPKEPEKPAKEDEPDDESDKSEDPKDKDPKDKEPEKDPKPAPKTEDKPKEPAQVPAWKLRIAEKRHQKELEEARKGAEAPKPDQDKSSAKPAEQPDEIDALATKYGLTDEQKPLIKEIIEAAASKAKLPPEVAKLLELAPHLEKVKQDLEEREAEAEFADEFDREVRPLVEAEYPQATAQHLQSIKTKLRETIFTDARLTTTPLSMIYQGLGSFRGLVPSKKSAEPTRGSSNRSADMVDFENITPEQYDSLSDDQKDQFADYQMQKERNR